ncbi:MAG: integrase core domain-containing protein [Dehalococcoidia bacterium]|nr:integrase core domain-containing protein [Dehalococcoidia bacterium]
MLGAGLSLSYLSEFPGPPQVQVLVEQWRQTYNRIRPHSALGYRPPAPEATLADRLTPALVGLT